MSSPLRWFESDLKRLRRYAAARPSGLWDFSIVDRAEKVRDDCQSYMQRDVTSATEIREILREVTECLAWLYHGVANRVAPPANLLGLPTPTDIRAYVLQDIGKVWFATKLLPARDKNAAIRYRDKTLRPVLEQTAELASKYIGGCPSNAMLRGSPWH